LPSLSFSVDTDNPKIFKHSVPGFGYQVCHFGSANSDSLLVTSPVLDNVTGVVYKCSYNSGSCEGLKVGDHGIALGLSLTCDGSRAVVCGPHLSHDCDSFSFLNGQCMELSPQFTLLDVQKPAFQECRDFSLDAVILFDDSQSIKKQDFATMIIFIKNIIRMFTDPRTQVAVAQYSTSYFAVFHFENFAVERNPDVLLREVHQSQGQTFTPSAIRYVLTEMLVQERGMRPDSKKLLVVITDGRSNDPRNTFDAVIPLAEKMGVVRYAIGVGKDYSIGELRQIASSPSNVFESDSFDALNSIQEQVKEKLFSIEGTSKSTSTAFQMELSQGGFSTLLTQDTKLFGVVGAYEWSGGIEEQPPGANSSFINASAQEPDIKDSYLGYSLAVAQVHGSMVYFAGAPRFRHMGLVLGFQWQPTQNQWAITHRIYGTQLGSYFGAVLGVLPVSGQAGTNPVLLVGAPHFHGPGVGGEVRLCALDSGPAECPRFLRGSTGNEMGQFGASLSTTPDLSGDDLPEVAVGAPLEDGGRGALYLFLSRPGGLDTKHSQRILGARLDQKLHYFGLSLHSDGDLSSDGLSDLVVGSRGAAIVLRSQPVVCVRPAVTLHPAVIPQDAFHCAAFHDYSAPVSMATVCVTVVPVHTGRVRGPFPMEVSMSMSLDSGMEPPRLHLVRSSWRENVSESTAVCFNVTINIPECISDYTAVPFSGELTVGGHQVEGTGGLRSVLSPSCPTSFTHPVSLEEVCGDDYVCVSDLQVTLNVSSLVVIKALDFPVDLVVHVSNQGEDAAGAALTLTSPSSLSFSQATKGLGQVSLRCTSNSLSLSNVTQTVCQLGSYALRQMMSMAVRVSLQVSDPMQVEDGMTVTVSVSSTNENNTTLQDNSAASLISTRLPVNVLLKEKDSTHYLNFPENITLEHAYMVENVGETEVPLNVSFILPLDLGSGFRWNVSLRKEGHPTTACTNTNISTPSTQHCSVPPCRLTCCVVPRLLPGTHITFTFDGNVSSDFEVPGANVRVATWANMSFDQARYIQYPADLAQNHSLVTVLETAPRTNKAAVIAGSIFGSLLFLVIIAIILYKIGFFKSKHENEPETEGPTSPPDDKETVL
ncbi:integrin alpha-X-like, partial [Brienomyrus brachyistius]|uniref:integrin alpha-X-like n=1 Tax=Brienomyrus brachyistius TaxID=42636 RepID=UPI0020B32062